MADELAGTWVFNDNPDLSGSGTINVNVNFTSNERDFTNMLIIKGSGPSGVIQYDELEVCSSMIGWNNGAYKTINITSKLSEVTDGEQLLTWLQENATKQEATRISIDLTTLSGWSSLSSGTHNITIVAKADGYRDSEPSEGVTVTKQSATTPTLISFTIDGTSYQAEEGMTWGEWVESSYNTDGFAVFTNKYIALNASKLVSTNSNSSGSVLTSDVIESDYSYQLAGSGSGN